MQPILFDYAERKFTTNGIGRLDCIECTVTEERNGVYELEMVMPITAEHYNEIIVGESVILARHDDTGDMQPFDVYEKSAPIDGKVTFRAHHISYRLSDIVVMPYEAGTCADALQQIQTQSANANPFTFWTDKAVSGNFVNKHPSLARGMLAGNEGSILDVFGTGEYEFDKFTVKLHLHRGTDSGVEIRYGKNLTDIKHDVSAGETYNAIVPFYLSNDGELVTLPEKMLVYEGATIRTTYLTDHDLVIIRTENNEPIEVSYRMIDAVPMDLSQDFSDGAPTVEELRNAAIAKFESSGAWEPKENIDVNFVQLWQTDQFKEFAPLQRVRLCDTVSVFYDALGVNAVKKKVIKTVYNVLLERYDSIELGELSTSIAQVIAGPIEEQLANTPTISMMDQALDTATQLIRGGLGGYVVMNANADGKPEEILIMDKPDVNEAVQVIRMNKNGIAFSSTGYNGPFLSAWTIDGAFVADFITAGTLNANVIRAGVIADVLGNTNWNLETGVLTMTKGSITLGGGNFSVNDSGYMKAISGLIAGWQIENNKLYSKSGTGSTYYEMSISPGEIVNNSHENSIGSLHDLTVSVKHGEIWMQRDSTMLSSTGPAYDGSNNPVTAVGVYKPYTMFMNRGGNIGMWYGGGSGTSPYGAYFMFGQSVKVNAAFTVTGSKSREAATEDYADRLFYCYEMASPMFGDVGEGVIGEDGLAYITIDPIFSEAVTLTQYQVFLQPYGEGDLHIDTRAPSYFVVKGTPGLSFGWELKAKQKGYEQTRLEQMREFGPEVVPYEEEAVRHLKEIKSSRGL